MIKIVRERQLIVLSVNILSPKRHHVNIGKTKNPAPEPINLADHTDSERIETILQAYQNIILVGTPNTKAEIIGLFSHHFHKNCEFSWNHPKICPKTNRSRPSKIPVAGTLLNDPQDLFRSS